VSVGGCLRREDIKRVWKCIGYPPDGNLLADGDAARYRFFGVFKYFGTTSIIFGKFSSLTEARAELNLFIRCIGG